MGPEFGKDARKTEVIDRALCGLKSARTSFRNHLAKSWNPWDMSLVRLI